MAAETSPPPGVDEHAVPAGTAEVAAHGEGGGGLPQFKLEYWSGQIIWLFLIFAVLYVLLAKVFVPRLRRILDTRASTIATAVEEARRVQGEAHEQARIAQAEVDEARAKSRSFAADAKAKAAAELARSQAAEDERLAAKLAEAEARIRQTRDQAMSNVGAIAGDTARAVVEKLTGKPATAAEIDAAMTAPQGVA